MAKTYLNPNAFKDGAINVNKLNENVGEEYAVKGHGHGSVTLTGDVTGSASLTKDGASITTTVTNDSHNHTVSTITDFTTTVDARINSKLAANDAMIFKGTIGTSGTITTLPSTHDAGWTYKVATAGTYAGQKCEVGDLILCTTDGTAANDAHWTVVQTNNDGCVSGPSSATSGNFAAFDGTTGKLIKDSGYNSASFQPAGSYAAANHNHDGTYQPVGSYAAANHNHDGTYQPAGSYAAANHNHDSVYSKTGHTHSYAAVNHNHDGTYQPAGSYAAASHTHNYAGSSSAGGSATSAVKLDTATAGSATQPCYFANGKPSACTYTLAKSVPSNAVFTDTNTTNTAGGSNTTSTIYPVGMTSQSSYAQTYTSSGVTIQGGTKVYASGGFFQSSDETLKNFYNEITVDFEELKKIPKVYYSWKDDETNKKYIGTSAQKVQEVYPELVEIDCETNKLSVDYPKFTMISLKAVDMLYDENQKLKSELKDIKTELQMIKEKLGF